MPQEKVSIIIPVYNVERYLDRCVESVLRQSYSNFEVLLVDDGSPDNCGAMCDRWAEKDARIRVIHKENGGLSDARNAGLAAAAGNLIAFADSDDFIAADMIEKLFHALAANDADLSICNFHYVDETGAPLADMNRYLAIRDEVLSGTEAITNMQLERDGGDYDMAWNKLYKKDLFSDIRFPVGKLCEDGFISHRLLGKCARVACISDVCYYYTQRGGSIMHSSNPLVCLHQAEARLDRMLYCYDHGMYRCAGNAYWRAAMFLIDTYANMGANAQTVRAEAEEALRILRENTRLREYCTPEEKLKASLTCLSPQLYCLAFKNPIRQRAKAFLKKTFKKAQ